MLRSSSVSSFAAAGSRASGGTLQGELQSTALGSIDAHALIESAYSFKFGLQSLERWKAKGRGTARQAMQATGRIRGVLEADVVAVEVPPRFNCNDKLTIVAQLPPDAAQLLWTALPVRYRHREARCLFSTAVDGCRMQALFDRCGSVSPTLLVVRTSTGGCLAA